MFNSFKVSVALVLGKRKINSMKDRVNDTRFKFFNECSKSVGVKYIENMSRKSVKGKAKRSIVFS